MQRLLARNRWANPLRAGASKRSFLLSNPHEAAEAQTLDRATFVARRLS